MFDLVQELVCIIFAIRISKSQIPNITGNQTIHWSMVHNDHGGSLYPSDYTGTTYGGSPYTIPAYGCFNIDASLSSDRYGNYTEVNPLYCSCGFAIKF